MNHGVIWTGGAESDLLDIFNREEDFSEGAGESFVNTPVNSSRSSGNNHCLVAAGLAA